MSAPRVLRHPETTRSFAVEVVPRALLRVSMRTATPKYSKLVYTAPSSGKSTSLWSTLVGFITRLQAELQGVVVRVACAGGRASPRSVRPSHPSGIAAPLIGCIGLILSPHSRLSGTQPLRDLATRRRATKTAAQGQPQFCKSHLPKAHVLRPRPCEPARARATNVQIGPTAAAFDRKLGYQVAQKEPAALSLA